MERFNEIVESEAGSKFILQGNEAFALGVIHAGFHAADGYPGTPSTEVIDKSLKYVQDLITVGWSVNEAVAVGVAIGHSIAGSDAVVTMKIPGVFQAGDAITTSAFYTADAGALVIYAATDYAPSSTQHVIDSRYFFSASRLPVIEPRNHQDMYEAAWIAADISRKFNTPVIVLASGILAHSEGLVLTRKSRKIERRPLPEKLHAWMLMPEIARRNYNKATQERIPYISEWLETSPLVSEEKGNEDWGIVLCGESDIIVREALKNINKNPSILSLGMTYPLPKERIKKFASGIKGKIFVFEDGDRYLENQLRLLSIPVVGKEENSVITDWTPEMIIGQLSKHIDLNYKIKKQEFAIKAVSRPPSICPGCPYRAFALCIDRLKKKKKLYAVFGDIGCSTLLHFLNSLDTVCCMGASDSLRQGFVLSRPEYASKTISLIGDSCECHTGLDSTRNAIFRHTAGIKVILDNSITAMTGGQPAPSSKTNLAGVPNTFSLKRAVEAEGGRMVVVDSYNLKEVEKALVESLAEAEKGVYTTMILEGLCIQEVENKKKIRKISRNYDLCKRCLRCNICPGIEFDADKKPSFTNFCTFCGGTTPVCLQCCPFDAIIYDENATEKTSPPVFEKVGEIGILATEKEKLADSMRLAIRGIGGQGNLFFGKALSEVVLRTPYSESNIVKGDTHGMAQLGGPVISTFSCGSVYSPVLAPGSVDVLIVMEISEVLRPGFLELLKPNGTILFNNFLVLPIAMKREDYPDVDKIFDALKEYHVIKIDANKIAYGLGDINGKTANVVVLGLLSSIAPFNSIPENVWLSALMAISPNDYIKATNKLSFEAGRKQNQ
ncbi:MAG: 2-oxoacid:acceptor oxidoreductase family protein [Syntrophales bacterium]|nr:2-oxoacid:acceptor oxidoreductase family protein [Syntrophales bacterium]